jgi:hypothetical protein
VRVAFPKKTKQQKNPKTKKASMRFQTEVEHSVVLRQKNTQKKQQSMQTGIAANALCVRMSACV